MSKQSIATPISCWCASPLARTLKLHEPAFLGAASRHTTNATGASRRTLCRIAQHPTRVLRRLLVCNPIGMHVAFGMRALQAGVESSERTELRKSWGGALDQRDVADLEDLFFSSPRSETSCLYLASLVSPTPVRPRLHSPASLSLSPPHPGAVAVTAELHSARAYELSGRRVSDPPSPMCRVGQ